MSADTFFYRRNSVTSYLTMDLLKDEVRKISVDLSAYCGVKTTSISSATFTSEYNMAVSISGNANASNVASANFTGLDEGREIVTFSATLANGEKLIQKIVVGTEDPRSFRYALFDYAA